MEGNDEYKDEMEKQMKKIMDLFKGSGIEEYMDMEKLDGLKDMFGEAGSFDGKADALKDMFGKYLDPEKMKDLIGNTDGLQDMFGDYLNPEKMKDLMGGMDFENIMGDICKKLFGNDKKKKGY